MNQIGSDYCLVVLAHTWWKFKRGRERERERERKIGKFHSSTQSIVAFQHSIEVDSCNIQVSRVQNLSSTLIYFPTLLRMFHHHCQYVAMLACVCVCVCVPHSYQYILSMICCRLNPYITCSKIALIAKQILIDTIGFNLYSQCCSQFVYEFWFVPFSITGHPFIVNDQV